MIDVMRATIDIKIGRCIVMDRSMFLLIFERTFDNIVRRNFRCIVIDRSMFLLIFEGTFGDGV